MGDGVNIASRLEGDLRGAGRGVCLSEDAYRQVESRLELQVADLEATRTSRTSPSRCAPICCAKARPATQKPPQAATKTRGVWARWPALAAELALVLIAAGAFSPGAQATRRVSWPLPLTTSSPTRRGSRSSFCRSRTWAATPSRRVCSPMGSPTILRLIFLTFPIASLSPATPRLHSKAGKSTRKRSGRELRRALHVLEGSVRPGARAKKVEINAQLISTETGARRMSGPIRFEGERRQPRQVAIPEVVARLANSLGVELMKAEVLRDERERPGDPDARDLTMRGFATIWNLNGANKTTWNDAIAMFERALALDPQNARAMTGLAIALLVRPYAGWSDDPAADYARAEKTADAALALRPDDSDAHMVKSYIFEAKSQPRAALAEAETAIADDPNNARAIEHAGYLGAYFGHAEDGVAAVETALRLSPHDPTAPVMQVHLCYLHNNLAQWEQAIGMVRRALANNARERRGNALAAPRRRQRLGWSCYKEAKDAVAELRKVDPPSL